MATPDQNCHVFSILYTILLTLQKKKKICKVAHMLIINRALVL